jgi:NitT/TauT family transport system permease protein
MVLQITLRPLIIIWLGYGLDPNIVIAFGIASFQYSLYVARFRVESDRLDLIGAWCQVFTKVSRRAPVHFSGLKVATILAIAGAVVGEFIGCGQGLGFPLVQVRTSLDTRAMFMTVVLLTLVGVTVYLSTIRLARLCIVKARLR